MHNFFVSPLQIILFLILISITTFSANFLRQTNVPISIPKIHIQVAEDKEVLKPEITWSSIPIKTNGVDRKYGNIISMQVFLRSNDFAKAEWWSERIEELLKAGKTANLYDHKTIIIFPEHIGTGLVFLDEKESVLDTDSWQLAMDNFVTKHEGELLPFTASSKKSSPQWESSFRLKAQKMVDVYQGTFSRLAKEYKVPILAGTIILPSPKVVNGRLVIDLNGPLYNVSIPFSAEGKVMNPLIKKTLLNTEEGKLLEAGDLTQDRIWVVPGWKVGVFIGQEVFNSALFESLRGKPLDGLVSPSVSFPSLDLEKLKPFIDDPTFENLSETEVWEKHGLAKHIKITRAIESVQVFLHGNFFGVSTKGRTYNIRDYVNFEFSDSDLEPRILNLYF